jgi:hypothetical protein
MRQKLCSPQERIIEEDRWKERKDCPTRKLTDSLASKTETEGKTTNPKAGFPLWVLCWTRLMAIELGGKKIKKMECGLGPLCRGETGWTRWAKAFRSCLLNFSMFTLFCYFLNLFLIDTNLYIYGVQSDVLTHVLHWVMIKSQ